MSFAAAARPLAQRETPSVPPQRPPLRLRRVRPREDLKASIGDAAAVSAMIGIGETYFAAFALALGAGETIAGLVATVPMLIGATLQLATPWFLSRAKSYKRWVVRCASLQAAALLVMPIAAAFSGSAATAWVFLAASLYWAAGQATGPAWNTWIEEIVPRRLRAKFFACRARIGQFATLTAFVSGALALEIGKSSGWLLAAFALIFLAGSGCRFLSAWFLNQQTEPSRGRYSVRRLSLQELFGRTSRDVGLSLVTFLLVMQTAVQISGPYFAPFMLGHHKLSYVSYMVLIGIGYFGKVLAMPLWGRVAHSAGPRRLLRIGGAAIVPVAGLWLGADLFTAWHTTIPIHLGAIAFSCHFSAEMAYLAGVQLISGIVWAAYELAMALMFFEAIPRQDRPSVMTLYNLGNSAAQVTGGLIGAAILQLGNESHAAYMVVFGCSSLMRLLTVIVLLRNKPQPKVEVEVVRRAA